MAVEAGAGQQGQLRQRRLQVAGVVAMLQPEPGDRQVALVQVQRQRLQDAQVGVAGFAHRQARGAVLVGVVPAGAGHVPHRTLRQLVERRGLQLRVAGAGGFGGAGGGLFLDLQQRVVLQHLADFLLQLQAVELQQADGLQQGGREVELLPELGGERGFHGVWSPWPLREATVMEHILRRGCQGMNRRKPGAIQESPEGV